MLSAQIHRGPDGGGSWTHRFSADRQIWFAHRRLSIIDLSEAKAQPMADAWATRDRVQRGALQLRGGAAELQDLGVQIRSTTSTEVVLEAYAVGRDASRDSTGCARWRSSTVRAAGCSSRATATATSRSCTGSAQIWSRFRPRTRRSSNTPRSGARPTRAPMRAALTLAPARCGPRDGLRRYPAADPGRGH